MHPQPRGPPPQLSPRAKVTINLEMLAQKLEGSRDWPVDAEKTRRLETAVGVLVQCMPGADELAVYTDDLIEKVETSNKALRAYGEILKLAVKRLEGAEEDGPLARAAQRLSVYFELKTQWENLAKLRFEFETTTERGKRHKQSYLALGNEEVTSKAEYKDLYNAAKQLATLKQAEHKAAGEEFSRVCRIAGGAYARLEVEHCLPHKPFPVPVPEVEPAEPAEPGPSQNAMRYAAAGAAAAAAAAKGRGAAGSAADSAKRRKPESGPDAALATVVSNAVKAAESASLALKALAPDLVDYELDPEVENGEAAVSAAIEKLAKEVKILLGSGGYEEVALNEVAGASVDLLRDYMKDKTGEFSWAAVVTRWGGG